MGQGTPDIEYTLCEISDDILDLVLSWRKEMRRRQVLKRVKLNMTREQWVQAFADYLVEREILVLGDQKFEEAFVQFAKDLVPFGHGLLAKEAENRIAKARKGTHR